ncbi:MAG: 2Fe-2S iron-sulfur cluster binding domain-containing protein [SAR324 cluster bacterium]|nr:2Fe-2S iron-sulfur cluster binding domain-containing protein [SAR324 cluster bacterium]
MKKCRVAAEPKPKQKYKIIIPALNKEYIVDPNDIPYGKHGLPGSVLDVIGAHDEEIIDHACGGVQACSTCHIYVKEGDESTNELSDIEQDCIDKARGIKLESRMACCCVGDGSKDIVIEIPSWNVNAVKEGKD